MVRFVGCDIHKRTAVFSILAEDGALVATSMVTVTRAALRSFAERQLGREDRLAMEATTNTWAVAGVLRPFVAEIVIGNPLRVRAIAEAKIKTDKVDARWLLVQAAQHLGQYRGPLGHTFRRIARRKNRKVAVVACARKLAVLLWHVLSSGEPFRYALPGSLQAKYARLRVRATGRRLRGGVAKGTPRSPQYGHGRTRRVPSLDEVLQDNGLPATAPLPKGETSMLVRNQLRTFYDELQTPSRVEVGPGHPQIEDPGRDEENQLTQS